MNVKEDKIIKDLYNTMRQADKKGTQGYDTPAEVTRIDGDTAWVHIPGGVDETPVRRTIDARKGDTVQVRVSGGNAWITGNVTAPPTDDYTAKIANQTARKAQLRADSASDIANKAQASADGKNTIYYDATQPIPTEGGFKVGDTWFNSAEDNAIYRYNGTTWIKEEIGEDAIANLSITNAKIANGTIQDAKIANLDGAKITAGSISANKIDINGLITVGELATDSDVSTAKSEAISTASADATTKANNAKLYADNYLTTISGTTGISVHSANDTSNYVNISSSAVNVVVGGENVSSFGSTVRIGAIANDVTRAEISSSGFSIIKRGKIGTSTTYTDIQLGHMGYDETSHYPYFTFGQRYNNSTIGAYSVAEGYNTTASGWGAHAEGHTSLASASGAHAEGSLTTISSISYPTKATNTGAHAEGIGSIASGEGSHAEGFRTTASGNYSHSAGARTTASYAEQTVIGRANTAGNYAFIIGNGTYSGNTISTSNALTVDWSGNLTVSGNIYSANTWRAVADTYDTIKLPNGNDGWIKIGTSSANSGNGYGLLPNASGTAGSGHGYLGTSSWYWKYAYIDTVYGSLSGKATSASYAISDTGGMTIAPYQGNEVLFGGTGTDSNIYFGYRAWGSKSAPTAFRFGASGYGANLYFNHAYAYGDINILNAKSYRAYLSGNSTLVTLLWMSSSNQISLGNSSYVTQIYGSTVYAKGTSIGSDIRLKENIKDIGAEYDNVLLNINPISFDWKKDIEEYDGKKHYGIIAQELIEKLKEQGIGTDKLQLVEDLDGKYCVCYTEFIPMLIHLCQSQQREIDELKEKLQ